ncbi:SRPBCC family protein [Bacillus sp. UNC41MFS5]|uniref:SRPBCC family protein n=1 Tax=Bacillus sp. UNC41MFS5 TaxID=1449046 RepID=UPI00047ECEB4|nr:SRPBCC family protein [Bacillus sp. UNC41MFS5]
MTENSSTNNSTTKIGEYELVHTRIFEVPRELVFEAWINPDYLANWWGPKGFTNSFHKFDMQPGGTWEFTMHGPDGTDFPNKVIFVEIVKPERIVLKHVSGPRFQITAIFEDIESKTRLTFRQAFETARVFDNVKTYAEPGNEQNLDRLEVQLAKML